MLTQALLTLVLGVMAPLQDGIQAYDTLQFERALVALQKAETEARTLEDRVAVQLYLGLTRAELGSMPLAKGAFRNALVLNPAAELPVKTSPKIEAVFQELKGQFAGAAAAAIMVAAESEKVEKAGNSEESSRSEVPPDALGTRPAPGEIPGQGRDTAGGPRVRPLLFGGSALAAVGGGITFGLLSARSNSAAREEPVQVLAVERFDGARSQALTANLMYGAAAALAVGALVDYFLLSPAEPSAP